MGLAGPFAKVRVDREEGMAQLCSVAGPWICAGRVIVQHTRAGGESR